MSKIGRNHSAAFKAKVALEALAGEQTVAELAAKHGVHQTLIHEWKRLRTQNAQKLCERGSGPAETANAPLTSELYKQIGQLKVENDVLSRRLAR